MSGVPYFSFARNEPAFRLIFGVYFATYLGANTTDTLCTRYLDISPTLPVLFSTVGCNAVAGMMKDRALLRMLGTSAPKPLPWLTFGMWTARDLLTIAASFTVVPAVTSAFYLGAQAAKSDETGTVTARRSYSPPPSYEGALGFTENKETAKMTAQIICPMAVQSITTPFHLIALDLYNRPTIAAGDTSRV